MDAASQPADHVTVGGVVFEPVADSDQTFQQQMYNLSCIRKCGLQSPEAYGALGDARAIADAILVDAYDSGHLFLLLAARFRRQGEAWDRAQVDENAALFAQATGPALEQLAIALGNSFLGVFLNGRRSAPTSPTSSETPAKRATPSDSPAPARTTMANGTRSSARSRATTPRATTRSRAGRSGKGSSPTGRSSATPLAAATTGT